MERGLRPVLQPVLYFGAAALVHALLFLIPGGGPPKPEPSTSRGVRVKAYSEGPRSRPAASPADAVPPQRSAPALDLSVPGTVADKGYSMPGSDAPGTKGTPGGSGGDEGGPAGTRGPSQGPVPGAGGPAAQGEYGQYLARLRSEGVQGWARDSARMTRQGWKGSGAATGGDGAGSGKGSSEGTGTGQGGWRGKGGGGGGPATRFLDPRVKMIVTSYPPTGIESRHTSVSYPDLKLKKHQYTSGWWNVYIQIRTDKAGNVTRFDVLRPETDGTLERIFVEQVKREVARWTFDPTPAEIIVDVRFHVE